MIHGKRKRVGTQIRSHIVDNMSGVTNVRCSCIIIYKTNKNSFSKSNLDAVLYLDEMF